MARRGPVNPKEGLKALVRVIGKDKAKIVFKPRSVRFVKALMDLFPGLGPT